MNKESKHYTIEPHGFDGGFVLYVGRDCEHHGANLCTLSEFDLNGEATREMIVDALNERDRLKLYARDLERELTAPILVNVHRLVDSLFDERVIVQRLLAENTFLQGALQRIRDRANNPGKATGEDAVFCFMEAERALHGLKELEDEKCAEGNPGKSPTT